MKNLMHIAMVGGFILAIGVESAEAIVSNDTLQHMTGIVGNMEAKINRFKQDPEAMITEGMMSEEFYTKQLKDVRYHLKNAKGYLSQVQGEQAVAWRNLVQRYGSVEAFWNKQLHPGFWSRLFSSKNTKTRGMK